jgi:gliding motility-associated-like protein
VKVKKLSTYLFLLFSGTLLSQKFNLLRDSTGFCQGDSAYIEIKQPLDNNTFVHWTTPDGIIANTKKVRARKSGKYSVRLTSPYFVTPLTDSSVVTIYSKPKLTLRDTIICKGKSVILDAKNPGMNYLWNTFETTQKIRIENPGRYWVVLTNGSCNVIDTVFVKLVQGTGVIVNNEANFCLNEENRVISVKVNPGTKIHWSTGATSASIYAINAGTYWVRTEINNCGAQVDTIKVKFKVCECEMMIPNSFTPNEDNRNDYFFPVAQCEYTYYMMTITDRWGNTVFTTNNINTKWDGRFKGNLCPEDVYIYKIESTEKGTDKKVVRNGHISLFR